MSSCGKPILKYTISCDCIHSFIDSLTLTHHLTGILGQDKACMVQHAQTQLTMAKKMAACPFYRDPLRKEILYVQEQSSD